MHPATKQSDIQRLQNRVMTLATDRQCFERRITELERENAQLRAELAATMLPYMGHQSHIRPDGTLVIVQGSGVVYEMVEGPGTFTDTLTDYRGKREFRRLPSVPGSPAARIDAAMPLCEMGVLGDAVEVA